MIKVIDLEKVEFSPKHGTYGGNACSKDGIMLNDEMWILKYFSYVKEFKDEHNLLEYSISALSEYIASNIFNMLGYQAQETILAKRYDSLVVACKDFAVEKELVHITKLLEDTSKDIYKLEYKTIKQVGITYDDQIQSYIFHFSNNPIFTSIKGITERFWTQSLIDILINNNDRCDKNWGILKDKDGNIELSPAYDNANSLPSPPTAEELNDLLSSDETLYKYVLGTTSTYIAVKYKEVFIHNKDLRKAVLEVVPLIESKLADIFSFIDEIPECQEFEDGTILKVCDSVRKDYYKKHLQIRYDVLLKPLYEAALNYKDN